MPLQQTRLIYKLDDLGARVLLLPMHQIRCLDKLDDLGVLDRLGVRVLP